MHPAISVIVFTILSGAGYGLIAWLAGGLVTGVTGPRAGLAILAVAMLLVAGGLASSRQHLGRPSRARDALGQWRTSWLAREGVLAIAGFPVAVAIAAILLVGTATPWVVPLALLLAVMALATVYATGMVYRSLPTVPAWRQPLVPPVYVALALSSGGVLFVLLTRLSAGRIERTPVLVELAVLGVALLSKLAAWRVVDAGWRAMSTGAATDETRRETSNLRGVTVAALFALPAGCLGAALFAPASWLSLAALLLATAAMAVGIGVERWLFFAEAEHAATSKSGNGQGEARSVRPPRRWP